MITIPSNRTRGVRCGAGCRMAASVRRYAESLRRLSAAAAAGLLLAAAALAGGCTKDLTETPGTGPNISTTKGYATVQLIVPGVAAPATYAAEVADETRIAGGELHAVVYSRNEEGNWQFLRVSAPEITTEGQVGADGYKRYDVRIPFQAGDMDRKFRIGIISGITDAALQKAGGYDAATERWAVLEGATTDDEGNAADNPLAEARDRLAFATAGKWPVPPAAQFVNFPMWGETGEFVMRPEGTVAGVIRLMRAVARVDVGVNFQKTGGKFPLNDMKAQGLYDGGRGTYFGLESVSVFRTSKNGTYGASKEALPDGGTSVTRPTLATGGVFPDSPDDPIIKYQVNELTSTLPENHNWTGDVLDAETAARRVLTRQCYVPETENKGREFDAAACLVVGGRFGGKDAAVTYYRIDFATVEKDPGGNQFKPTPRTRMDILRNNAYVVNITSVAGPGAPTEKEALYGEDTKLTAEVVAWDQSQQVGDIVTDGVYMLWVDKSEQQYYCDGTAETFTVETDYDGELGNGWQLTVEGSDEFKKALRYYEADGTEHAFPSAAWPEKKTGPKGSATLRIGMAELGNNPDGSIRTLEGKLIFAAGRMKTQVVIQQTSRDNLRILFDPEELYFGPQGDPKKGDAKSVGITVTTKKPYKLSLTGTDSKGKTYTYELEPGAGAKNPDDQFQVFFRKSADAKAQYELLPTNLADAELDRVFTFELKAELPGSPDVPAATESFTVYQVKEPVTWSVVDEPQKFELRTKPWQVIVPHDATQVQPKIETSPGTLVWWFSKGGSTTPDDSWLTNLQSWIGKKIEHIAANYAGGFLFTMEKNPGLARRSITLQAESNTPGLVSNEARLVITQKGAPLMLRPEEQNDNALIKETQKAENGRKGIYTLDHGAATDGALYTLDMYSNTDWYWYWNTDNEALHNQNMKYLAQNWAATPGENIATTDGPKDGRAEKKWEGVATFRMPDFTASEPNPKDQPNPATPPGGQVTVVRELRNSNPELTEADVADYARELRITRELPAYTHIVEWPFENQDGLPWNLDKMSDPQYNAAKFKLLSNAPFSLTLAQKGGNDTDFYMAKTVEYTPSKGYEAWERLFKDMPGVMNRADMDPNVPATVYRLTASWQERDDAAGKNVQKSESRLAYTGYHMVMPKVNLPDGAVVIAPSEQKLRYDFSNSMFLTRKVRIKKTLCYTNYTPVEDTHALYEAPTYLNGEAGQNISTISGRREDVTVEVTLAANTQAHLLWALGVEFLNEKTGTWAEDPAASPIIFQDGTGTGGMIAYYDGVRVTWPIGTGNFTFAENNSATWKDIHGLAYQVAHGLNTSSNQTAIDAVNAALTNKCCSNTLSTLAIKALANKTRMYQFFGSQNTNLRGLSYCARESKNIETTMSLSMREEDMGTLTNGNSLWMIEAGCPFCHQVHRYYYTGLPIAWRQNSSDKAGVHGSVKCMGSAGWVDCYRAQYVRLYYAISFEPCEESVSTVSRPVSKTKAIDN